MKTSNKGLELIARFEGWVSQPYNDAAGHATIGYGHLLHLGRVTPTDIRRWGTISKARGLQLLATDAKQAENAVNTAVRVPISQNQFDALVSLAFNVGGGAVKTSTLVKKINVRDYAGAANEFGKWVKAGGRTLPGLVVRRKIEAQLFRSGAAPSQDADRKRTLKIQVDRLKRILTGRERLRKGGVTASEQGEYAWTTRAMNATKERIKTLRKLLTRKQ